MKAYKPYKHYGVEVIKQVIDKPFKSVLAEQNMSYIDLPILMDGIDIIKYTTDNRVKYAVIKGLIVPDEFYQAVYITHQIPDDLDWNRLVEDVDGQEHGEDPMRLQSKLKVVLDKAELLSRESLVDDIIKVMQGPGVEDIGFALIQMGYRKAKLRELGAADDVDPEYLQTIIKWLA